MTNRHILAAALLSASLSSSAACDCGVAPERQNDFFWENELFGMRAYGPGEDHKWSGLDVFNKDMREGGTCADVLHNHDVRGNWHLTPWKGVLDNYAVGAGRGLGGVAIYGDGEWKTYPDWETCEILTNTEDLVDFKLTYPAASILGKMTYHITLRKGAHFFRNEVSFERNKLREGFWVGPGLDLAASRGHAGDVWESPELGLVSLYEKSRGDVEGATMTAVILDPASAEGVELKTDPLGCRILAAKKSSFVYYAGANWSRNGTVASSEAWHDLVRTFAKRLRFERAIP